MVGVTKHNADNGKDFTTRSNVLRKSGEESRRDRALPRSPQEGTGPPSAGSGRRPQTPPMSFRRASTQRSSTPSSPTGNATLSESFVRTEFNFLADTRTRNVTPRPRSSVVAAIPGVVSPPWLQTVLDDNLHFKPGGVCLQGGRQCGASESTTSRSRSPTLSWARESVQIHNHGESATRRHRGRRRAASQYDAWQMGTQGPSHIYRDNCKVGQPLSTTKVDQGADTPPGCRGRGAATAPRSPHRRARGRTST